MPWLVEKEVRCGRLAGRDFVAKLAKTSQCRLLRGSAIQEAETQDKSVTRITIIIIIVVVRIDFMNIITTTVIFLF